ncbi:hypothetical protein CANCADRAFT_3479 [Tortispora caseinolytica NRRL Y-17796]|uniref:Uncharacterized protein n=1 Tax=Tortispora caseinolytica NRRL Y-17796 TaxID=767744 RepID=A0A1E4TAN8_9ASCO|nr:hypothetical protein CANCADRAFT_3479 [Tortispora caseinolytica NRRL Y-17796]
MSRRSTRRRNRINYSQFGDDDAKDDSADSDVSLDGDISDSSVATDGGSDASDRDDSVASIVSIPAKKPQEGITKIVRIDKSTSLDMLFTQQFGFDSALLADRVHQREFWSPVLVNLPDPGTWPVLERPQTDLVLLPQTTFTARSTKEILHGRAIHLIDTQLVSIEAGTAYNSTINTGYHVTDMSWTHIDTRHILAVSLLSDTERYAAVPSSAFERKLALGVIQLWSYEDTSMSLTLIAVVTHNWGSAWNIKWRDSTLQCLCVFQDGNARVLDFDSLVSSNGITYQHLDTPSVTIESSMSLISCACWNGPNEVVMGFDNGYVGLYSLHSLMFEMVVPCHSSYIIGINAAYPEYPRRVGVMSTDGQFSVLDLNSLAELKWKRYQSFGSPVEWSRHMHGFLWVEDSLNCRLGSLRNVHWGGLVSWHNGTLTAMSASPEHPLVLTGSIDGTIKTSNVVRKFLNKHDTGKQFRQVQLWQLKYDCDRDAYKFIGGFKPEEVRKRVGVTMNSVKGSTTTSPMPVNTSEVLAMGNKQGVTACCWGHNGIYAAGMANGLIRICRLPDTRASNLSE